MAGDILYQGEAVSLRKLEGAIAELVFDLKGDSVNKFNRFTLEDLGRAVACLQEQKDIKGLMITSGKPVFIVGADITEFEENFQAPDEEVREALHQTHSLFNTIEDLPYPTVSAINGLALGGGLEICLTTSFRLMAAEAAIGLPETQLGIYPGWGGTVRLPRLIGADNAIEWIASGKHQSADVALKNGAVDGVVAAGQLRQACLKVLEQALDGKLDWQQRRQQKISPLQLRSPMEGIMVFETAKGFIGQQAGPHYPAPVAAIKAMQASAAAGREEAIENEIKGFIKLAKSDVADSLVGLFLSDQFNKKKAKDASKLASREIKKAAVLGAGIMGGGVAYQSAVKGTPILMKDINDKALELGMSEANKLLQKQLQRGRITGDKLATTIGAIHPTLNYADFESVDVVVEAVVENEKVKKSVLAEVENKVAPGTILSSNTSTISITKLATALQRPEDFCGMHFFNPVHQMPLVEVIRGEKTSEKAVGAVVAYALAMGKTPVVVNDCPGFLVNRVLSPYLAGFAGLVMEGADFRRVDKVMEKFGWPMGPAYLLDVVGIDTAVHAGEEMARGFPDRMSESGNPPPRALFAAERLGQKNGRGFYRYEMDKRGKPKKIDDPSVDAILAPCVASKKDHSDEEILDRIMIPMINEAARCLEEKIVDTAMEVDLGLIYGIGFPPFHGGALKYADRMGLDRFCEKAAAYTDCGPTYEPAPLIRKLAAEGAKFYQN